MGILLGYRDVKKQSEAVFKQFGESKWIPYARENAAMPRRDPNELERCGLGRVMVLAAYGESLEDAIPVLRKYRDRFDLAACDKAFAPLMDAGIVPDFVQLCDCNIPFRWVERWIKDTASVKLLCTAYANVEWTRAWLGPKYFYANRDALGSERHFLKILGENTRTIPAGSNVSNAMVTFFLGVDERSQVNWAGYDKYLLTGFDYSWRPSVGDGVKTGKYYAFDDPKPKRHYMHHRTVMDYRGDVCHTSENLLFSAKWLYSYVTNYSLPVLNCSGRGLLDIPFRADLEDQLSKVNPDGRVPGAVRSNFAAMARARESFRSAEAAFENSRRMIYANR